MVSFYSVSGQLIKCPGFDIRGPLLYGVRILGDTINLLIRVLYLLVV